MAEEAVVNGPAPVGGLLSRNPGTGKDDHQNLRGPGPLETRPGDAMLGRPDAAGI
jgi:hypothetical protein